MRYNLIMLFGGALMMIALPVFAAGDESVAAHGAASLLNQANQINKSEEGMASMLSDKSDDNLALSTLATTLKDDHQANQSAVKSLADEQNITLKSYQPDTALKDRLDGLKGSAFEKAFLEHEAMDHRKALRTFEEARNHTDNQKMKLYIDETIPVLKAHLEMIENIRRDMTGSQPMAKAGN
jgi:putative membrane protein